MDQAAQDYARVEKLLHWLEANADAQPELGEIARVVDLSPGHVQRMFARWVGISPKQFLALLTTEHAKSLLARSYSILDASLEVGLSGPGRLHDLFVKIEAMTPG